MLLLGSNGVIFYLFNLLYKEFGFFWFLSFMIGFFDFEFFDFVFKIFREWLREVKESERKMNILLIGKMVCGESRYNCVFSEGYLDVI